MARSTRKRIKIDIPLLTPRVIRRSIVHQRKIKTSTEKVPPVAKISIVMRKTKIVIVTIRINVSKTKYLRKHYFALLLIARGQITAKHREEKDKKDKEEVKVKEEPNVKMNHVINQAYHFNMVIKSEMKEVRFLLRLRFEE